MSVALTISITLPFRTIGIRLPIWSSIMPAISSTGVSNARCFLTQ